MSAPDRRAMVERLGKDLSVRRQCVLLSLTRSGVYRSKPVAGADDLAVMRRIDELHLELPFYGSRRMTFELNKEGREVNRKRVRRLMRVMGIEALVPRPGTSKAAPGHKIYPYLLRGLKIVETNHVWAADVTYIPMACGFLYLVAIIDWASRAVLAWRLSNTNDASFCAAALEGAASVRKAADFQYRSGLHFHRRGFHQQACDGRRRDLDGRTRPLHGQHFHRTAVALDQVRRSASESLRRWLRGAVRHQFLDDLLQFSAPSPGDEQPNADGGVARRHGQNRGGGEGCDMPLRLDNANALPTYPQQRQKQQEARSSLILEGQRQARSHLKFNPSWSHEWGPVHLALDRNPS
jgi:putative transposase